MSNARKLADNLPSEGSLSERNMIINGAMQVAQRGTSKTLVNGQINFCTDRWHLYYAGFDNFAGTLTQDSDVPAGSGFANSLKITTTTAESAIASDEYAHLSQLVEAQNLQQLAYGTSAAKQLTLSFYVKSSITGTFACGIYKQDNTAQIHNLTYTIDAANTWERKTLTFAANTLSGGAIDNNNGIGFYVNWHIAAGSSYKGGGSTSGWSAYAQNKWADGLGTDAVMTTTNATFFLTGCQLEVGPQSTPFEHRSYGEEFLRCCRYYYSLAGVDEKGTAGKHIGGGVMRYATGFYGFPVTFPAPMRAVPTLTYANITPYVADASNGYASVSIAAGNTDNFAINGSNSAISGASAGSAVLLYLGSDANHYIRWDAEL